jgi:serine phosphatase RsbU (regulator of sigma subunit)
MAAMRAAQERIENELKIARDIQMSMVPSTFPEREGLDMYASMTPAKEVGGDLYGYVMQGDRLYFALGDVSGKGVPASLFMAQATRLFMTLAKQGMMPVEICTRMNDALSGEDNESGMFVTLFLGLVDLTTWHLDFCNAGHNPPVIGGGENNADFLEMQPNAPIGLWPGLEYEGEEIDSIKGRPLFIYTDGLNEAENRQQEQFGDDRLLDILRHTQFDTAQQVIDTLKAEVEQHRDGAEPNDDLTMMCIRVD